MSHTPWRTVQRQWALHQGGNNTWYRIRNQIDGPTQLHIYDEIGYFGVSSKDLIRDLADVNGPLELHLNSPGGEVHEGIAIYNTLMGRHDVTVMIDGLAASIASVIAMAGNPILIARTAQMMVHDGFAMAIGNAQDLRDQAEVLDKASNLIAGVYADHTGKPPAYWREVMKAESWFDSQEAIDAGLADRFIPSSHTRHTTDHRRDERWDLSAAFRGPADLRGAAAVPYVGEHQTRHEPTTTRHRHDHAAGGADDHDDGIHYHFHEHNNDADHREHDHSAIGYDVGPNDRPINRVMNWDGAAAMAACASADDPAAAYRSVCAGKRAGDPSKQSTWALPHHNKPGGPADPGGVSAALGRLDQTQGLTNKSAARAHLEAHQGGTHHEDSAGNPFGLEEDDFERIARELRGVIQ